jgi:hypothetical protein
MLCRRTCEPADPSIPALKPVRQARFIDGRQASVDAQPHLDRHLPEGDLVVFDLAPCFHDFEPGQIAQRLGRFCNRGADSILDRFAR